MCKNLSNIFLMTVMLSVLTTGCVSPSDIKKDNQTEEYIVTTEIPKQSYNGITDNANPAFIKIYPHFNRGQYSPKKGPLKWFTTGLGSKIPPVREGLILETINTDKDFIVFIGNINESIFEKYFNDLTEAGYTFEGSTHWDNMNLFNEQYAINLRFCQDGKKVMTVRARTHTPQEAKNARKELIAKGIIFEAPAENDTNENNDTKASKKWFWQK